MELTAGDVLAISRLSDKMVRQLCEHGILAPQHNGVGTGHYRVFSIPQVTAMTFAYRWKQAGFANPLIRKMVAFISSHTETQLKEEFKAGRKYLIPLSDEPLALTQSPAGSFNEVFNLQAAYKETLAAIAVLVQQTEIIEFETKTVNCSGNHRGRKRGLAKSVLAGAGRKTNGHA